MVESSTRTTSRRRFLHAVGGVGTAAALGGVAGASSEDPPASGDREELIVGVSGSASVADVEARLPDRMDVVRRNETIGFVLTELPQQAGVYERMRLESAAARIPEVKYTEENAVAYVHEAARSDAGTADARSPPSTDDTKFSEQYAPQQVNAPEAWETTRGSDGVTVAVIDTGIAYDHPDLEARFGDLKGKDFGDNDDDPYPGDPDEDQHGTHVAGIAAATTDNGQGIAGMSDSTLLACRVAGSDGRTWAARSAEAFQWAADQGADVINLSLGSENFDSRTVRNAIKYAINSGALVVSSAGNDEKRGASYPAAWDEVLTVSALDDNEELAWFSNYGDDIDVAGPGVDVLSCNSDHENDSQEYIDMSGTSMASPAVAGVAALGRAVAPDVSVEKLRRRIEETAADVGLPEGEQGHGRVDAAALVAALSDGDDGGGNEGPTATFSASSTSVAVGEYVSVDAADSTDSDGTITTYEWDFGVDDPHYGETAKHSYPEPGEYTLGLTITDDDGATDTASKTITVGASGCDDVRRSQHHSESLDSSGDGKTYTHELPAGRVCNVDVTLSGPDSTDFDLYVTLDGREPTTADHDRRAWSENSQESLSIDGEALDVPGELGILVHSYAGSGEYDLGIEEFGTLEDGGDDGDDNETPTATFKFSPPSPEAGELVFFDAGDSSDPDGEIASREWAFGDGSSATGETASTTYDEPGEYTVSLTVTDDEGATAATKQQVTVEDGGGGDDNEAPTAEFEYSPTRPEAGELVYFDAADSTDGDGEIADYEWAFGDGSSAGGETASNSYDRPGRHDVTLTVTDDDGATDTTEQKVVVKGDDGGDDNEAPTAEFTASPPGPAVGELVFFDAANSTDGDGEIADYEWEFGDGGSATGETASNSYDEAGEYTVFLTVTDDDGATDSTDLQITVEDDDDDDGGDDNEAPTADFQVSPSTVTAGEFVYVDASKAGDSDGEVATYEWAFGDGSSDNGETASTTYDETGEYTVTLTVTDDDGATDSTEKTVTVEEAGGGGSKCTSTYLTASLGGSLDGMDDRKTYTYEARTDDLCRLIVALSGPDDADFDLYLNTDGTIPTQYDYDYKSSTNNSQELISLSDPGDASVFGILVHSWMGSGEFDLAVEEFGN